MPGLSKLQKSSLCQLAAKAYSFQEKLGMIEAPPGQSRSAHMADWRHEQQRQACGITSLSQATNRHYTPLRARFLALSGDDAAAFESHLASGPARGRSSADDTPEARGHAIHLIRAELTAHALRHPENPITGAYLAKIAEAKHHTSDMSLLTVRQLTQLLYTAKNRIAAREGRGKTGNRNKSQRAR